MSEKSTRNNSKNKVTVLLDDDEWFRFDAYCQAKGHKKSTLIARLIREHLAESQYSAQRQLPLPGQPGDKDAPRG
jgi:hypothetical protein